MCFLLLGDLLQVPCMDFPPPLPVFIAANRSRRLRLHLTLQFEHSGGEKFGVPAHPLVEHPPEGHGVEVVPANTPLPSGHDDPRAFKHAQVLHDRETREPRKGLGQFARGASPDTQEVQNPPPGGVRQGLPDLIVRASMHM